MNKVLSIALSETFVNLFSWIFSNLVAFNPVLIAFPRGKTLSCTLCAKNLALKILNVQHLINIWIFILTTIKSMHPAPKYLSS
jgi:hypothetical protein